MTSVSQKWFNKKYGFKETKTHTRQDVVKITGIPFKDINHIYQAKILSYRGSMSSKNKKIDYSKPHPPTPLEKTVAMEQVYSILKTQPHWWKARLAGKLF